MAILWLLNHLPSKCFSFAAIVWNISFTRCGSKPRVCFATAESHRVIETAGSSTEIGRRLVMFVVVLAWSWGSTLQFLEFKRQIRTAGVVLIVELCVLTPYSVVGWYISAKYVWTGSQFLQTLKVEAARSSKNVPVNLTAVHGIRSQKSSTWTRS